jgi:hypothetical protein
VSLGILAAAAGNGANLLAGDGEEPPDVEVTSAGSNSVPDEKGGFRLTRVDGRSMDL